jgi:penicillin-binding protein 2
LQFRQAVLDTYTGGGDRQVELGSDTWMTVTEGMAQATSPGLYHTAEGAHLEGIDFAGKTGTAQVVGGGDTHTKGGAKTPNAWFVGMVPRRNPEVAVVVLQEHGDWGSGSAKLAAQIVTAYVNKKRRQENNLLEVKKPATPVEVGAIWSVPPQADRNSHGVGHGELAGRKSGDAQRMGGGHFFVTSEGEITGAPVVDAGTQKTAGGELRSPTLAANDAARMGHPGVVPDQTVGLPERLRRVVR